MCNLHYKYNHCNIAIATQLATMEEMWVKVLHSICNMDTCGLPNMHTISPRARSLPAPGRTYQADPRADVTNTKCKTFTSNIKVNI